MTSSITLGPIILTSVREKSILLGMVDLAKEKWVSKDSLASQINSLIRARIPKICKILQA